MQKIKILKMYDTGYPRIQSKTKFLTMMGAFDKELNIKPLRVYYYVSLFHLSHFGIDFE